MPRISQRPTTQGSQYWLQVAVNSWPSLLDEELRPLLNLSASDEIRWLSPLSEDGHAEYRDKAFLDRIAVSLEKQGLNSFWPRGGPVWDGLGKSSRGDVLLVEAKSHASELVSSCQAKPPALDSIRGSLEETATFHGADSPANWLEGYYQYANRLAHLYLMRHLNGIPAWLVFVYFVNDHEMKGPKSEDEWHSTIEMMHAHLGITAERLRPYVVDVFLDVAKLATHGRKRR